MLLVIGAGFSSISVAAAEELFAGEAALDAAALGEERALGAGNIGQALAKQIIEGSVGNTGSMTAGANAFANQSMVINAFNTGNNVNWNNQLAVEVHYYDSIATYNATP